MTRKLTKPQVELLADVYHGTATASEAYRPAQKLVEVGLCEWRKQRFGGSHLVLTPEGFRALDLTSGGGDA